VIACNLAAAPVPPVLKATESSAEDIVDFALTGDRANAIAAAAGLRAAARGSAAQALTKAGVPRATVALLRQRADRVAQLARSGPFIGIALAANAVSQLMADLYSRFEDRVPPSILMLDYLDREAELRSLAGQRAPAVMAVAQLGPAWARVRPRALRAGGAREAAAYTKHVAAMTRLVHGALKRLQAEAVRGLELVDELERLFVR